MKYRKVNTEKIQVAPAYQRALRSTMVSTIVKGFEEDAFGVLVIGERTDGSLWCVDGQTRLKAAVKLGMTDVPCLVFTSKGKEHEATLFRLLNTQTAQSKLSRFKALLCEGDPNTEEMNAIVERCGFKIGYSGEKSWPHIRTVIPVEKAYTKGVLPRVLQIVSDTWGATEDIHALQVPMLGGLTKFISEFGDVVADKEIVARLQKFTVPQLVAQCEARKMQGGNREDAMKDVLVHIWNRNRKKRLDACSA